MSKRILVVEDQPDNRQIIRDMLAGTDYEITEAEDGEQALVGERPDVRFWHKADMLIAPPDVCFWG